MRALILAGALLVVASAGVVAGILLQWKRVPRQILDQVQAIVDVTPTESVGWQEMFSNLHMLEFAVAKVSNVAIDGGSLEEVDGNIVLASTHGQLTYLDAKYELHPIGTQVPMRMAELRSSELYKNPWFNIAVVRTHDLLAVKTGEKRYDLYASFNRFAGDCFEFAISRVALEVSDQGIKPSGDWHDVWQAKPCVPLKDRGPLFAGEQSGGRMVQLSDKKLLVSIGDHQFDGFFDSRSLLNFQDWDLGHVVEIDIETGAAHQMASGLRNPQGLIVAKDGEIWGTDHGPQGGDEIDHITAGSNYGWPIVTYGMSYGAPPMNWPFNPKPGGHEGYTKPRFAFVPSIGITNIVEPDPREFPNWTGYFIVASLRGNALYLLKREGSEDIVYAEPIHLSGFRLRDMISMKDGRIAILADHGSLLFVRNADKHKDQAAPIEVAGFSSLPTPTADERPSDSATPEERGRKLFQGMCSRCHDLSGGRGIGPPLNGVVGRRIASAPNFAYSAAMSRQKGDWNDEFLITFLKNPDGAVPGTTMPAVGVYTSHAIDIILYLKAAPGS